MDFMKEMYYLSVIMIVGGLCICLSSCGSDDEDNERNDIENHISSVPEHLKPFIGIWDINASDYYHYETFPKYRILFYQENKCELISLNGNARNNLYSWDYDVNTKYLAIAGLDKGQWQITAVGDGMWSGLALWNNGNNGYSAKNTTLDYLPNFLLHKTWINGDVTATTPSKSNIFEVNVDVEYIRGKIKPQCSISSPKYCNISYDSETDIVTIHNEGDLSKAKNEETEKTYCHIEIFHPFSYNSVYMDLKYRHYDGYYAGRFTIKR